ncbi:hypothetical protein LINPERPRIM_LOCUS36826 [Linum perenne]
MGPPRFRCATLI